MKLVIYNGGSNNTNNMKYEYNIIALYKNTNVVFTNVNEINKLDI